MSERERFEAWAREHDPALTLNHASGPGDYRARVTDAAWAAWQARAAQPDFAQERDAAIDAAGLAPAEQARDAGGEGL